MKRILIVEDDKYISLALNIRLRASGYETLTAWDAIEGVNTAYEQKPNLILLDIEMPGGGGFKVAEYIRNHPVLKNTPLIFITASKQIQHRERAKEFNAAYFFEKPYNSTELLSAIATSLN